MSSTPTTPAGWYPDQSAPGTLRYWDGVQWTPQRTAPLVVTTPPHVQTVVLESEVRGPRKSVTKQRKHTSHTFHLLMTIITAGAWGLFVWLPIILWHRMGPRKRVVTRYR